MKDILYLLVVAILVPINIFAQGAPPITSYQTPQMYAVGTEITPLIPTNTGGTVTPGQTSIYSQGGFSYPQGIAIDPQGNVYIADTFNHKIKKLTNRILSVLAGNGAAESSDGIGISASFSYPQGIAIDTQGNVYVADAGNNKIRKITPAGAVTTFAGSGLQGSTDGISSTASFYSPYGVAVDSQDNIYVADYGNNKIRKITQNGVVSTLAGSGAAGSSEGIGLSASFKYPVGITVDSSGNVYVADSGNYKIRKITPIGVVSTLAGGTQGSFDGVGTTARFNQPRGLTVDTLGNVYVADSQSHKIRRITPSGVVETLAGQPGSVYGSDNGSYGSFYEPSGVALDSKNNIYVADKKNNMIRKITGSYQISPPLPTGLELDGFTGIISGTPSVESPQTDYRISVINDYGGSGANIYITVNKTLGIEDVVFKNIILYPNPTKGAVNINNVVVEKVNVYDSNGKLVKNVINPECKNIITVQLDNLPTGLYFMYIETEETQTVRKIQKL